MEALNFSNTFFSLLFYEPFQIFKGQTFILGTRPFLNTDTDDTDPDLGESGVTGTVAHHSLTFGRRGGTKPTPSGDLGQETGEPGHEKAVPGRGRRWAGWPTRVGTSGTSFEVCFGEHCDEPNSFLANLFSFSLGQSSAFGCFFFSPAVVAAAAAVALRSSSAADDAELKGGNLRKTSAAARTSTLHSLGHNPQMVCNLKLASDTLPLEQLICQIHVSRCAIILAHEYLYDVGFLDLKFPSDKIRRRRLLQRAQREELRRYEMLRELGRGSSGKVKLRGDSRPQTLTPNLSRTRKTSRIFNFFLSCSYPWPKLKEFFPNLAYNKE